MKAGGIWTSSKSRPSKHCGSSRSCSPALLVSGPSATRRHVQHMPRTPYGSHISIWARTGSQEPMHSAGIPCDDLLIPEQLRRRCRSMVFEIGATKSKPNGIAFILKERGIYDHYVHLAACEKRSKTLKCKGCQERAHCQLAQLRVASMERRTWARVSQ